MADQTTTVRLENKSAHVKYISLGGGGEVITIAPTDVGAPVQEVKLESDAERTAFARALETPAVKQWIDDGELVVDGGKGGVSRATSGEPRTTGGEGAFYESATPQQHSTSKTGSQAHKKSEKE